MSTSPHRRQSHRRAGRRRVLLGALMLALAGAPALSKVSAGAAAPAGTPVLRQSAELVSPPLGTHGRQGTDVALSADGSTLAVASLTYEFAPSTVVVYVRSGDHWLTQTTLRAPTTEAGSDHWSDHWASAVAISADGDTLAVGNPRATVLVGGTSLVAAGDVHLFNRSGQTWRAAGRIVSPQPLFAGWFGTDVSLSGDGTRVIVGTNSTSNSNGKQAYIADAGSQVVQKLPTPAGAVSFGHAVAISPDGETVVVGAPYGGANPRLGEAFVLVDDPVKGWVQRWRLEARSDEEFSDFGTAVAVTDADTVVVGAPNSPHQGVSVFDRRGSALVRTARFAPQYDSQAYGLGSSVAVSADGATVVAGAPYRTIASRSIRAAGAGYRWVRSPAGWSWAGLLSVAHPNAHEAQGFSTAMAGDGRVVVLGAPGRRTAREGETGAAIVFSADED